MNTALGGVFALTLTGSASPADYQTALRAVTFSRSASPANPTRRFAFQVTDAQGTASNYMITDADRMEAR